MKKKLLICIIGTLLAWNGYAASEKPKYNELIYGDAVVPVWDGEEDVFYYSARTKDSICYYVVDCLSGGKRQVTDAVELGKVKEKMGQGKNNPQRNRNFDNAEKPKTPVFIKDNNVFYKDKDSGQEVQLSFDGSVSDPYTPQMYYSPDSSKVVVMRTREVKIRQVSFVESSPKESLQPQLHTINYTKPGDELAYTRPCLFDLREKKAIGIDLRDYLNPFSLHGVKWRGDGKSFTFEYNERGHQRYDVAEVSAADGKIRTVIRETSPTFIYYRKLYRYDMESDGTVLWISERDGWRHLYSIDYATGKVKKQITKGEWVVRDVQHIDTVGRVIYFTASGINKSEDPYNVRLYRIGMDGRGMKELTTEAGNHAVYISPSKKYFVNSYSTPEVPAVSVLRELSSGKVVTELEQADISDLLAAGWQKPEVFHAKGRDGKTDIWGNIYRPHDFDPSKKYPVIEYIYAGPHDSHVAKNFHIDTYYRGAFLERGFVVVQIDGMGTYNRSKAFHDVCWQNLKDAGFPDRILWMQAAAEKYGFMDISNVGIYGVSAGGQNAMAALLFHGDFYKSAVASCGCHDNRMDKIWWNEQWMGYPVGRQYGESSNVDNAHLLEGNLLLSVGELDNNVDPASTMQVVDALIKADKYFELLVLPGQGHTLGGNYGMERTISFFEKHMK